MSVNLPALPLFALLPVPALRRVCERTATISSTLIVPNHLAETVSTPPQDFAQQDFLDVLPFSQRSHPSLLSCAVYFLVTLLSQA